ncbi:uncharacterized protein ASCRUDRAFT_70595 [Ascoidea rubescens DSM 1968]|uniref:WD40 repeat-like protein n=1 Tax=Ascoidea rubescens DSM 1968 TaxID=1344418 RepID=A0A1D2VGD3_9ASCO|nr:hypothetical protein ASCRUDRAFT_70595 [Ascoidea rubescens DSM 1968]ODV60718.1 hypothetical protein ASCRUDRAFT_70595 [Ascoidea rubescens DSM 1968]
MSSNHTPPELPNFYYDAERKKYFKILKNHQLYNSLTTNNRDNNCNNNNNNNNNTLSKYLKSSVNAEKKSQKTKMKYKKFQQKKRKKTSSQSSILNQPIKHLTSFESNFMDFNNNKFNLNNINHNKIEFYYENYVNHQLSNLYDFNNLNSHYHSDFLLKFSNLNSIKNLSNEKNDNTNKSALKFVSNNLNDINSRNSLSYIIPNDLNRSFLILSNNLKLFHINYNQFNDISNNNNNNNNDDNTNTNMKKLHLKNIVFANEFSNRNDLTSLKYPVDFTSNSNHLLFNFIGDSSLNNLPLISLHKFHSSSSSSNNIDLLHSFSIKGSKNQSFYCSNLINQNFCIAVNNHFCDISIESLNNHHSSTLNLTNNYLNNSINFKTNILSFDAYNDGNCTPLGSLIALGGRNGNIYILDKRVNNNKSDIDKTKNMQSFNFNSAVTEINWLSNYNKILISGIKNNLKLFDIRYVNQKVKSNNNHVVSYKNYSNNSNLNNNGIKSKKTFIKFLNNDKNSNNQFGNESYFMINDNNSKNIKFYDLNNPFPINDLSFDKEISDFAWSTYNFNHFYINCVQNNNYIDIENQTHFNSLFVTNNFDTTFEHVYQ